MKKRTVTLVLAVVLALSVVGCGSVSEPKQEEQQQTQGQEKTETEVDAGATEQEGNEQKYIEHEFLFVTEKATIGEEKIDMDALEPNGQNFTLTNSVDIYGSRGGVIGYTKSNINVHVVTSNEDWYCLYFEQEEPTYQYVLVKAEDFLSNSTQAGRDLADSEETVEEATETVDPYDEVLSVVGYDKDKTYTCDEYVEVIIKIAEEMGKTYNPDLLNVVKENGGKGEGFYIDQLSGTFDFTDHEKTLENTKWIMAYFEIGRTGVENVTEVYIQKIDENENSVGIFLKYEY